ASVAFLAMELIGLLLVVLRVGERFSSASKKMEENEGKLSGRREGREAGEGEEGKTGEKGAQKGRAETLDASRVIKEAKESLELVLHRFFDMLFGLLETMSDSRGGGNRRWSSIISAF